MGVLLGLLCIRLGDLYVALVTLTFGLLMENLVFTRDEFTNLGNGVAIPRPAFAHSDLRVHLPRARRCSSSWR